MSREYERYLDLCRELWYHNRAYFTLDCPEIGDEEYDQLLEKIKNLECIHPDWVGEHSPTQFIGEKPSGRFPTQNHIWPMLSYDKIFDRDGLFHFHEQCQKALCKTPSYYADVKIDGCAVALWYIRGRLECGLTRGDGLVGDVITENLKQVAGIPHTIPMRQGSCEIRGEVHMPFTALNSINEGRIKEGLEPFSNTRNCTSGSLKSLDPKVVRERKLSFFGYFLSSPEVESVQEMSTKLASWSVSVPSPSLTGASIEEVFEFIQKVEIERESLPFRIDGIVVKLDSMEDQLQMGSTGQYYRWGVAFKYRACRVKTRVRSIFSQIGRSGAVTPVALLDPVYLDGSCVSKATLHHFGWAFEKGVREGDFVWICKGGDIIPQILEVDMDLRQQGTVPLQLPTKCHSCDSVLEGCPMTLRCSNPLCHDKLVQSLIHFADSFSIDGLGKRTIEELVSRNLVKDWDDLFRLNCEVLKDLPQCGPILAKKLIDSIEKSKLVPFFSFLSALGIPYIGKRNARALAKKCDSWDALRVLSIEELQSIPGFGGKVARSTYKVLSDLEPRVRSLFALGVRPFSEKKEKEGAVPFSGFSFVITGTFKKGSRKEIEELIRKQGGSVLSSISQKTDYLLVGESPGGKLEQAQSLNIAIVNEAWLFSKLEKVYQNVS